MRFHQNIEALSLYNSSKFCDVIILWHAYCIETRVHLKMLAGKKAAECRHTVTRERCKSQLPVWGGDGRRGDDVHEVLRKPVYGRKREGRLAAAPAGRTDGYRSTDKTEHVYRTPVGLLHPNFAYSDAKRSALFLVYRYRQYTSFMHKIRTSSRVSTRCVSPTLIFWMSWAFFGHFIKFIPPELHRYLLRSGGNLSIGYAV